MKGNRRAVPFDYGTHTYPVAIPLDDWRLPGFDTEANGARPYWQVERVRQLRKSGYSVRKIAYLTGIPVATVGDWCKLWHESLPEPMPFYTMVEF